MFLTYEFKNVEGKLYTGAIRADLILSITEHHVKGMGANGGDVTLISAELSGNKITEFYSTEPAALLHERMRTALLQRYNYANGKF